jgi:hypothetical protein
MYTTILLPLNIQKWLICTYVCTWDGQTVLSKKWLKQWHQCSKPVVCTYFITTSLEYIHWSQDGRPIDSVHAFSSTWYVFDKLTYIQVKLLDVNTPQQSQYWTCRINNSSLPNSNTIGDHTFSPNVFRYITRDMEFEWCEGVGFLTILTIIVYTGKRGMSWTS